MLAVYVGRGSLSELVDTVLGERGVAALHFLLGWLVAHARGGLPALRLLSALFAVASLPLIAAIANRRAGRRVAVLAGALAAASWMLLCHGVYARMYSLFLFASALSYLALLSALRHGGRRRWLAWGAAVLLTVASHPYGALVLASQGLFVLLARERLREAVTAFALVGIAGTPFWIADVVLARRFDVGLGGGGEKLGNPVDVIAYLGRAAGDFSVGHIAVLPAVLLAAAGGVYLLARENRRGALLVAAVVATPTLAFLVTRVGRSAAPETRHLAFVLPFFATLVALPLARAWERRHPAARALAAVAVAALLVGEVAWAWSKTPPLFTGDPETRAQGREAASRWLAETGRPDDVLLGYEPVYLGAWERSERFSRLVLPRADPALAAEALRETEHALGRGVWVFDAYDTNNLVQRLSIPAWLPRPAQSYEARTFGPYLVVRTREAVRTSPEYLRLAAAALLVGRTLDIGDADTNFDTVGRAAALLGYEPRRESRSSSSTSR